MTRAAAPRGREGAVKVDGGVSGLREAAAMAREQEAQNLDGLWSVETGHDPFLPLLVAAMATERVELGTGIAVAFARSPMTTAVQANDLQLASRGRFILGLGTQIKPHIEKRFSMPWSHPAARMREYVLALRAIWECWQQGSRLDFRGDFYTHTLMTPFFSPGPNPHGPPKVFLAAVGSHMAEVAGEVADGLLVHPFTTARYLEEVTLPAVQRGLERSGRRRHDFQLAATAFVVTGTEAERAAADTMVRSQIAFYGSTPAYRGVLERHGWADLQTELNGLSKQGRWTDMAALVTDEILDAFAVVCDLDRAADRLLDRWGATVDRLGFYFPVTNDPGRRAAVVDALRAAPGRGA
ncbi:MAG TPA: LLM class F420-dependent oxidoreductase [Acidimicrobiales bacterium]|nr:LLM class F420-dependent oxidoreductase [Acidimicrobiales bacterium]